MKNLTMVTILEMAAAAVTLDKSLLVENKAMIYNQVVDAMAADVQTLLGNQYKVVAGRCNDNEAAKLLNITQVDTDTTLYITFNIRLSKAQSAHYYDVFKIRAIELLDYDFIGKTADQMVSEILARDLQANKVEASLLPGYQEALIVELERLLAAAKSQDLIEGTLTISRELARKIQSYNRSNNASKAVAAAQAKQEVYTMMLVDDDELVGGEIVAVVETYTDEETGDGYRIIKVAADSIDQVIIEKPNGEQWQGDSAEDGVLTSWIFTGDQMYTFDILMGYNGAAALTSTPFHTQEAASAATEALAIEKIDDENDKLGYKVLDAVLQFTETPGEYTARTNKNFDEEFK